MKLGGSIFRSSSGSKVDILKVETDSSKQVKCPYNERGCYGMFCKNDLQGHIEHCGFSITSCPLSPSCNKLLKKDLSEHLTNQCPLRRTSCVLCKSQLAFNDMRIHLESSCPVIRCANGCGSVLLKNDISNHELECPCSPIDCEYKDFGCDAKIPKIDAKRHNAENIDFHMSLMCKKMFRLESKNNLLTIELETLKVKNQILEELLKDKGTQRSTSPILNKRNSSLIQQIICSSDNNNIYEISNALTLNQQKYEYDYYPK